LHSLSAAPRTLPHSAESEKAVLACVVLDPSTLAQIRAVLDPEDFYEERHRLIFESMVELVDGGAPVDLLTVEARLDERAQLEGCGGVAYLATLDTALPDVTRAGAYAAIVARRATARRTVELCGESINRLLRGDELPDVLAGLHTGVVQGLGQQQARRAESMSTVLHRVLDRLEEPTALRFQTGIPAWDDASQGMPGQGVIVAGAATGMGKTALALTVTDRVARRGERVLYLSWEMSSDELALRHVCARAEVPFRDLVQSNLLQLQWEQLIQRVHQMQHLPIRWAGDPGRSAEEAEALIRLEHSQHPLGLVVVDYVQLVRPREGLANRTQELGAWMRQLLRVSRELPVPVLALSQLSRGEKVIGNVQRQPRLTDIRDSGEIEQTADQVVFLWRYNVDSETTGADRLYCAKDRQMPAGWERSLQMRYGMFVT
jgi:replicative DNA helicase